MTSTILSLEFDKLNPIEKLQYLNAVVVKDTSGTGTDHFQYKDSINEMILIALLAIDCILKEDKRYSYSFYILGDVSVKRLIERAFHVQLEYSSFVEHLMMVDEAKLIYRFTCARKFMIEDSSTKQLRLNSWGHEYIKECSLLEQYADAFEVLCDTFRHYFREHDEVYKPLMKELLEPITPERSHTIKVLNDRVDIKLLS